MRLTDKEIDEALNEMNRWFVVDTIEEKMDTFNQNIKLTQDEEQDFSQLRKQLEELLTKTK
jgi:hypothetical protein